jgi:hypothetical protein
MSLFRRPSDYLAVTSGKTNPEQSGREMIVLSALGRRVMKSKLLIAAGCVAGIVGVRVLIAAPSWFKQRRENRQFIAVNNLTPERLIARCGSPVGDETKNLYPIIARNLTYKSESRGTVVFKFSKTAEESSDWVFTSMQDSNGATEYESPSDKIAALSCLDSRK